MNCNLFVFMVISLCLELAPDACTTSPRDPCFISNIFDIWLKRTLLMNHENYKKNFF